MLVRPLLEQAMTPRFLRLIRRSAAPLATLGALSMAPTASVTAQSTPGYTPSGPPPSALPPREERAPTGRRIELPSAEQLAGPATPALLQQQFALSEAQATRYSELYQTHIATTAPQRDSAYAVQRGVRAAVQSRDQPRAVQQAELLEQLWKSLQKTDRSFEDKTLRPLLTKEQDKSYKQWRDAEQKRIKQEREKQMG